MKRPFWMITQEKSAGLLCCGTNADVTAAAALVFELDRAIHQCEQRMISSNTYMITWFKTRSSLADENRSAANKLTRKTLHTQKFGVAIPSIPGTPLSFFMSHILSSYTD
jgi:hypothetical protein